MGYGGGWNEAILHILCIGNSLLDVLVVYLEVVYFLGNACPYLGDVWLFHERRWNGGFERC